MKNKGIEKRREIGVGKISIAAGGGKGVATLRGKEGGGRKGGCGVKGGLAAGSHPRASKHTSERERGGG